MWQPMWTNAPISIVTSSDIIPLVSKSLKACWFLNLALWRQSGELYGTVNSIRMTSLALTFGTKINTDHYLGTKYRHVGTKYTLFVTGYKIRLCTK